MNPELGRFLEDRSLEMQKLLVALRDLGEAQGRDVTVRVDGRELVFSRGEGQSDRGFVRLIPADARVVIAFPRGGELFDPRGRLTGPIDSQKSLTVDSVSGIDAYVRRLFEAAYGV